MSQGANLRSGSLSPREIRVIFFVAGLSNFIRIQTGVQIIPTEIMAVILGLFSLLQRRGQNFTLYENRILRFLNIFCLISVLNQVIVDSIQNVDSLETLKSIAQTVVLWSLFRVGIIYFKTDVFRFIAYVAGFLLSALLQLILDPSLYMQVDPWKFALGPSLTGMVFLLNKSNRNLKAKPVILVILVVVDVYLGSRSLALFTILALAIINKKDRTRESTVIKSIGFALTLIFLLFGIERIYYHLSTDGTLGHSQQLKSLDQYKAGPILLAGRSELAYEVSAIVQNPFLGNGSSPALTYDIQNRAQKINSYFGVQTELTSAYESTLQSGHVPQHSMLFSAWVEGGIMSFIFWVLILSWTIKKFIEVPKRVPPLGDFATYAGLSTLWALVFSPLGAGSRMELVVGLVALLQQSRNRS
jgi:hypothetical protein